VPFLADNYAYVLVDHATRECAAIDPADPYGVKDLCDRLDLNLTAILTTHKHHDHAGGNHELQKACGGTLAVYGHALDDCAGVTRRVSPGDVVRVGQTRLGVVHVPCHTTGHVVYAVLGNGDGADGDRSETVSPAGPGSVDERASDVVGNDDGGGGADAFDALRVEALFTGDAVINGGVGAFFHGGPRDCYDNLHVRLRKMPDAALVFSGHEYMQMNLKYARWLDESCEATSSAARQVAARRHRGLSTMPSSLAVERRVNPYFRVRDRAYVDKIQRLERHLELGKRRRWYRRYFPERRGKDAADERARADRGIVAAEDVELGGLGEVPAPPTTAESLRCIETLQSLTQYRHLIEDEPIEAPRASRRDGSGAEGEADGEPVERTSTGRRRAPAPGPVAL
jgi:hydroxyacylglutathione hydrolase